ncbi:MAG: MFS transporter [Chitinophagales bacterium]|nr:MFS transporter [Chitinophagales bacterium]
MNESSQKGVSLLIIVAALGYFVDIYDLVLFNVVKKESLEALGFAGKQLELVGKDLFNWQMGGMLLGGILWGILGDKKGRITILFGSILLYSLANLANAFVTDIGMYKVLRFLAGLGLAGELGAGITLVSESMHKDKRGIGTMIIVTFGALGAVVAQQVATKGQFLNSWLHTDFDKWQIAYIIGGILGLLLLVLRVGAFESGMFKKMQESSVAKGDLSLIFKNGKTFLKYLNCILIGLPIWCVIGVLINMSNVFGKEIGTDKEILVGTSVMYAYIGLSAGDLLSGLMSQLFKSRKKIMLVYQLALMVFVLLFLLRTNVTATYFYMMCFLLGLGAGYWALFVTNAAEQFGTNIRSTVANTVPNFVRGAVIPVTNFFMYLTVSKGISSISAALIVSAISFTLSIFATFFTEETFGKDLNYVE